MKLLIITQKVDINDDNLGFFHDWIKKFAECADVEVIANCVGDYDLPSNVKVFSLGKENGAGKFVRFFRYQWLLLKLLQKTDGIFFHMCPEYVLGAGLLPKVFEKKTLLWYAHKSASWRLKFAEKLVNKIFTPSKESFRLDSKKVEITGHGIDIDKFKYQVSNIKHADSGFKIISVGRVAKVKNLHLFIEVAEILKNKKYDFHIKIAGAPILETDREYFKKIKEKIKEKNLDDIIKFVGPISSKEIIYFYQSGDLFVNLSDTGSIDKAIVEAMSCGLKILTSNDAFKNILKEENITDKNPENISNKIISLEKSASDLSLRGYAVKNHNLDSLIIKIIQHFIKDE